MRAALGSLGLVVGATATLALLGSASAAPSQPGAIGLATTAPGQELIVAFSSDMPAADRNSLHRSLGAVVVDDLLLANVGIRAELVRLGQGQTAAEGTLAYESNPLVKYAEPNGSTPLAATFPNDFQWANLWGLHNTGQTVNGTAGTADADIDAPEAWDLTTGSTSVVVGVADTGMQYDHPDLLPNRWTNPGETGGGNETDGVDDDGNGYVDDWRGWDWVFPASDAVPGSGDNDPRDLDGHGTHVAGTIGAQGNDSYGVAGVNWQVKLMPLRICGAEDDGCLFWRQAKAFTYAHAEGAAVVNASLGGPGFSQTVSDAIANAPNTLFVVAAGNETNNNDVNPRYPCQYVSANIVCVAASTQSDGLASFSNWGASSVDLAAPGTNTLSDYPPFVVRDGFGANASGWTFSGTNNQWGWVDFPSPKGGYLADSPGVSYVNNTDSFARLTNPVSLANRAGCKLAYFMRLDVESATDPQGNPFDWLGSQVSTDGANWTTIFRWYGSTGGAWQSVEHSLAAYDGQAQVYLRFWLHSDGSVTGAGADLDDAQIQCPGSSPTQQSLAFLQGTSMATPHVAGAAALLKARRLSLTPLQIKQLLVNGVDAKPAFAGITVTGGRLNLDRSLRLIPTAVVLSSFRASRDRAGVTLTWRTRSDHTVLGFNLWRATRPSSSYRRITTSLIPSRGGAAGASYRYLDRAPRLGQTYLYKLELVGLDGKRTSAGPVRLTLRR